MADSNTHFRLRMPEDLKEFVRKSARQNERSLNSEVVFALRQYEKTASDHTA